MVEKVLAAVAGLAIAAKFALVTGASEVLMITLSMLSVMYFVFGIAVGNGIPFRELFSDEGLKGVSPFRMVSGGLLGLGMSTAMIGILYKFLNLAGANGMLIAGAIMLIPATIVLLLLTKERKKTTSLLIRSTVTVAFIVVLSMLSRYTLPGIFHRNCPRYVELLVKMDEAKTGAEVEQAEKEFDDYTATCH